MSRSRYTNVSATTRILKVLQNGHVSIETCRSFGFERVFRSLTRKQQQFNCPRCIKQEVVRDFALLKHIWPRLFNTCCNINSEMQFTLRKLLFWPTEFLMRSRVSSRRRNFQVSSHLSSNRKGRVLVSKL